jgi:hypothetical protein
MMMMMMTWNVIKIEKRVSYSFHHDDDHGKRARKNNIMVTFGTLRDATNRIVQTDTYKVPGVSGSSTALSDAELYRVHEKRKSECLNQSSRKTLSQ